MSPSGAVLAAAVVLVLAGTGSALARWAFCTRPIPRGMRIWLDLALAAIGVRLLLREMGEWPIDWWAAAIWWHVALVMARVAGHNLRAALGPGGDRCPE